MIDSACLSCLFFVDAVLNAMTNITLVVCFVFCVFNWRYLLKEIDIFSKVSFESRLNNRGKIALAKSYKI